MDIYVLEGLNGVKDIIENFQSSIWDVQYNGKSEFQLIAPATEKNLSLLQYGAYLVREEDMSPGQFKNVMIVENLTIDISLENGWLITASGHSLKSILDRRIIWEQYNFYGHIEDMIRTAVNYSIINPSNPDRKIDNFILGNLQNLPAELETQVFGENLGTWIEEVCQMVGYGYDVYIKNGKYVFDIYNGTDRTSGPGKVIFSPTFDNLLSSTYRSNRESYSNAALIGGEGERPNQKTASIGTASGLDRFESYIDGSSVSSNGEIITLETYIEFLKGYGQTQLSQKQFSTSFEGVVEPTGVYNLNEDYYLGDLVLIENELGITATSRINEIIYAEDENGSSVVPTFSEWEVS